MTLNEQEKQNFHDAVSSANSGQKAGAYNRLLELARKNPDEVDLLLWTAYTAPSGNTANRLIRRAWTRQPENPNVIAAKQWLENTYPLEAKEAPQTLDLDDLTASTESPPPPPFVKSSATPNPPPPPFSPPQNYQPAYNYVPPPPFMAGQVYANYAPPAPTAYPYGVMQRAPMDMSGWIVFLIFMGYLCFGFVVWALLGSRETYGATFWGVGFIAAIGATIETSLRRAKYGPTSGAHPGLVFLLVWLASFFSFALYMADYHRFRYRRDHGWYGPIR